MRKFLPFALAALLASCAPPQQYQWMNMAPDSEVIPLLQGASLYDLCNYYGGASNYGLPNMYNRTLNELRERGFTPYYCQPEPLECLMRGLKPQQVEAFSNCLSQQESIAIQREQLALERRKVDAIERAAYERERERQERYRQQQEQKKKGIF